MYIKKNKISICLLSALIISIICSGDLFCQIENTNWRFGYNAGLKFPTTGNPILISSSKMLADEGCVSVSDNNGNLLFYSNGISVWDKIDSVMPNGSGLLASSSSFQACLAIKKPFSTSKYFLFTTGFLNPASYSEIDMNLNAGLGDVTNKKNIILFNQTMECVCSIPSDECGKIWVIFHEIGNKRFVVYSLDSSGVSANPIYSLAGADMGFNPSSGVCGLKANSKGTLISQTYDTYDTLYVLHFDKHNGTIKDSLKILISNALGSEFSPNDSLLYVTNSFFDFNTISATDSISQINISLNSQALIQSSKIAIHYNSDLSGLRGVLGSVQKAPNGKIYVAKYFNNYIGCINNPNNLGLFCNYVDSAFFLGNSSKSMLGFPQPVVLEPKINSADFDFGSDKNLCADSIILFSPLSANTYSWSNNSNLSTINVQTSGKYWLTIQSCQSIISDTINVYLEKPFTFSLGNDTSICSFPITLTSNYLGDSYLWNNGSSDIESTFNTPGLYSLNINKGPCSYTDSITINYNDTISEIIIPNVFTPNADLKNDIYKITLGCKVIEKAIILNRWGEKMFEWKESEQGWDGKTNNVLAPDGVYFLVVTIRDANYKTQNYSQTITLLR